MPYPCIWSTIENRQIIRAKNKVCNGTDLHIQYYEKAHYRDIVIWSSLNARVNIYQGEDV